MESAQRAMTGPGQSAVLSPQFSVLRIANLDWNLPGLICQPCPRSVPRFCHSPHPPFLLIGKVPKSFFKPPYFLAKINPVRDPSCTKPSPQSSVLTHNYSNTRIPTR